MSQLLCLTASRNPLSKKPQEDKIQKKCGLGGKEPSTCRNVERTLVLHRTVLLKKTLYNGHGCVSYLKETVRLAALQWRLNSGLVSRTHPAPPCRPKKGWLDVLVLKGRVCFHHRTHLVCSMRFSSQIFARCGIHHKS
jgi:hypothetical protein